MTWYLRKENYNFRYFYFCKASLRYLKKQFQLLPFLLIYLKGKWVVCLLNVHTKDVFVYESWGQPITSSSPLLYVLSLQDVCNHVSPHLPIPFSSFINFVFLFFLPKPVLSSIYSPLENCRYQPPSTPLTSADYILVFHIVPCSPGTGNRHLWIAIICNLPTCSHTYFRIPFS